MKFLFFLLITSSFSILAAAPSTAQLKPEHEGCPENAHCTQETGMIRTKWLEVIKNLQENKINESKANEIISTFGYPISVWSKDPVEQKNYPLTFWDSPCKQHKAPNPKILIGELFIKSLSSENREKYPEIIFAKTYLEENNKIQRVFLPRGDAPIAIYNNAFYYTKEDEGHYYGLLVNRDGKITIRKTIHLEKFPKEVECKKNLVEEFYREAPSLNFFKGHFCKEIWNESTKNFTTILVGWSCN